MDELGYDVEWQVINSKYFVPQNRERIFIIGHLRGSGRRKILPLGEIHKLRSKQKEKTNPITNCITGGGHSGGLHSQMTILNPVSIMLGHNTQNGRAINGEYTFALTTRQEQAIYDTKNYRRLTPLECERLQGFPDNWTKGVSDTQRYKQLGNAVTTTVVEYIAHAMANQWK